MKIAYKPRYNVLLQGLQNLIMYSENLKKIRFELKLSARELADKIGVSMGSIQNYEAGKREPNYNFMQQLSQLNVNLNWFVTGKGDMFIKQQPTDLEEKIRQVVEKILDEREGIMCGR